jgi:hypothetical protein
MFVCQMSSDEIFIHDMFLDEMSVDNIPVERWDV